MVGSYAPKAEAHQYLTPFEDAPSGMLGRGTYRVTSCFTDDYKNEHLKVKHFCKIQKKKKMEKKKFGKKLRKKLEKNGGKLEIDWGKNKKNLENN